MRTLHRTIPRRILHCLIAALLWQMALIPASAQTAAAPENDGKLRVIAFGAHPDDCEIRVAGTAAKWAALGHHVKFVSLTNGDIGHWKMAGGPLAQRRTAEVQKCARILGITTQVLDIHLGTLTRRLRLLGIDAAYENPDIGDAALATRSATEGRILLSRDRSLRMSAK